MNSKSYIILFLYTILILVCGFIYGTPLLERVASLLLFTAFFIHYYQKYYTSEQYNRPELIQMICSIIGIGCALYSLFLPKGIEATEAQLFNGQLADTLALLLFRLTISGGTYSSILIEGLFLGNLAETVDEYYHFNKNYLHYSDYFFTFVWIGITIIRYIRLYNKRKKLLINENTQ